jgi:hypothetical protein
MTGRTEVLLKDLGPELIMVRADQAKEGMDGWAGERAVINSGPGGYVELALPPADLCYLKLATGEQLRALRGVFPSGAAVVEWPEAVAKNRLKRMRSRNRSPRPNAIPENGRRFIFDREAILKLFEVVGIKEPGKYLRGLDTCRVLGVATVPANYKAADKEPPEKWFPDVAGAAPAKAQPLLTLPMPDLQVPGDD